MILQKRNLLFGSYTITNMKRTNIKDYKEYEKIQRDRASKKWGSVTFDEVLFNETIMAGKEYIGNPGKIICLGIRSGNEYHPMTKAFSGAVVYGVDIHPEVTKVGNNCFAFDFNQLPGEWENGFDFIYSNSLDHAFNVHDTIKEWTRIAKAGATMLLVLSSCGVANYADVYDFDQEDLAELFPSDKFTILKVIDHKPQPIFSVFLKVNKNEKD